MMVSSSQCSDGKGLQSSQQCASWLFVQWLFNLLFICICRCLFYFSVDIILFPICMSYKLLCALWGEITLPEWWRGREPTNNFACHSVDFWHTQFKYSFSGVKETQSWIFYFSVPDNLLSAGIMRSIRHTHEKKTERKMSFASLLSTLEHSIFLILLFVWILNFHNLQTHVFRRPMFFSRPLIFATAFMSFFSVVIALFKVTTFQFKLESSGWKVELFVYV